MPLITLEAVRLGSVNVTEKMVQERIADDPSILGLGELELRDMEGIHAHAGRLDLLLQHPETLKRYEVELQRVINRHTRRQQLASPTLAA